ncbi:MAG: putative ribosome quality control (RQC) complex YloA/Tae2 family protein [Polyangiales bacterium]|jgi:predicted ribosome quality control (RQC) complex YloA/Tae2 family protein
MGVPLGRIQRIDGPQRGVLCLSLYSAADGKSVLLLDARGVHQAEKRPHGDPADGFVQRLRRRYTGAHLVALERSGSSLRLHLQTKEGSEYLTCEAGALVARDETGKAIAAHRRAEARHWDDGLWAPSDDSPQVWTAAATQAEGAATARLKSARRKLKRTRTKVEAELSRAEQAPALRHEADLLMAHLHMPVAQGILKVEDWLTNESRELVIEGSPHEHAETLYKRARRFERGVPHIQKRLGQLDAQEARLDDLALELEAGAKEGGLAELFEGAGIRFETKATHARQQEARLPYRQFRTNEGRIFVGRSARDNDELTLRVARPGDHWLHVRGRPGSHVVVPLAKGQMLHPELLLDSAHLAAHFSPASREDGVDVSHTERRYVRKRRGTPPGSVFLEREKTIHLRIDSGRVRRLLSQEIR